MRGFEVQREMGRLKSAIKEKQRNGVWLFFDMVRLRDGWDIEVEEHRQREILEVFCHSVIGGRFRIHEKISGNTQEAMENKYRLNKLLSHYVGWGLN